MNRLYTFIMLLGVIAVMQASDIEYTFNQPHGAWWTSPSKPELSLKLTNTGNKSEERTVTLTIVTDELKSEVYKFAQSATIAASAETTIGFQFNLEPGFYHCIYTSGDSVLKEYNIGYEPECIVSLPDYQPDFKEFWERARADLDSVAPEFSMERFPEQDSKLGKAYKVRMKSVKGEELTGYCVIPKKKGKYPAIINFMGYGSGPAYDFRPIYDGEFIYFQQSIRGQGFTIENNTHGEWMQENIADIENYYYRNAFMDVVRGVDFVYQMPEFDGKNLFAEGGSQGGALTMAATALDKRIVAAAPFIPFLSDYPKYLTMGLWSGDILKRGAAESGISKEQMLKNMTYFDMKNLCTLIEVPVLMGVGLQDAVCPPRTNFAGYNVIRSPKSFIIYPAKGHGVERPDWDNAHVNFFKQYMMK